MDNSFNSKHRQNGRQTTEKLPKDIILRKPTSTLTQSQSPGVLRLIDASLNRACEALRVVDDYARFLLDDQHLTQTTKSIRHRLSALAEEFSTNARLAMRETNQDVGTLVSTEREQARSSAWTVCETNLFRLQEALRSLEEFSKIEQPELAKQFESIRYESYTLAKMIGNLVSSTDRLSDAKLYVLIPSFESLEKFEAFVREICIAGADVIQLRAKKIPDKELIERAEKMVAIGRSYRTITIINDRPDIAAISHAEGVHVGQDELTVKHARSILGPEALVGVSTHNLDQLRQAIRDGASYVGLGPTFTSQTKSFNNFAGLPYLEEAAQETKLPAFAIGGISAENLPQVLATGCTRIAVSDAVVNNTTPTAAVEKLKEILTSDNPIELGSLPQLGNLPETD